MDGGVGVGAWLTLAESTGLCAFMEGSCLLLPDFYPDTYSTVILWTKQGTCSSVVVCLPLRGSGEGLITGGGETDFSELGIELKLDEATSFSSSTFSSPFYANFLLFNRLPEE